MRITPLGAILGGLVAGAVGTATMGAILNPALPPRWWKRKFLDWELSTDLASWDNARHSRLGKPVVA